jgi:hypothetical protein
MEVVQSSQPAKARSAAAILCPCTSTGPYRLQVVENTRSKVTTRLGWT